MGRRHAFTIRGHCCAGDFENSPFSSRFLKAGLDSLNLNLSSKSCAIAPAPLVSKSVSEELARVGVAVQVAGSSPDLGFDGGYNVTVAGLGISRDGVKACVVAMESTLCDVRSSEYDSVR